ncbi:natriuretic peptides B [Genypterus blacodes]|uniref:natriuretic peptides B n=1 Tax=Genypterus blacodes TaxID=154954 RepID=UPI003F7572A5
MQLSSFPVLGILLLLNLQQSSAYPISPGLTEKDIDTLRVLLHKLAESVSEQTEVNQRLPTEMERLDDLNVEEAADGDDSQTGLDEAAIREFLLAKNLKSVRNDPNKRSSGCFGRRMDRIGSMSSLGCNTIGKYSK